MAETLVPGVISGAAGDYVVFHTGPTGDPVTVNADQLAIMEVGSKMQVAIHAKNENDTETITYVLRGNCEMGLDYDTPALATVVLAPTESKVIFASLMPYPIVTLFITSSAYPADIQFSMSAKG